MPKSSKAKASKKRVKVEKLSGKTKKLSTKEAKKVKGGILIGLLLPAVKEQLPGMTQGPDGLAAGQVPTSFSSLPLKKP